MPFPAPVTIADSPANKTASTPAAPVRFAPVALAATLAAMIHHFPRKLIQSMGGAASERGPWSFGNDGRVSLPDQ